LYSKSSLLLDYSRQFQSGFTLFLSEMAGLLVAWLSSTPPQFALDFTVLCNAFNFRLQFNEIFQREFSLTCENEENIEKSTIFFLFLSLLILQVCRLKMIYCMLSRYGQKIDQVDAKNITIQDFLQKENFVYEAEIETYMEVWNKVSYDIRCH